MIRTTGCSSKGPGFNSQHSHGGLNKSGRGLDCQLVTKNLWLFYIYELHSMSWVY